MVTIFSCSSFHQSIMEGKLERFKAQRLLRSHLRSNDWRNSSVFS